MADQFDVFLKEVEEDHKREQLKELWNRYGIFIAAGVVALLASVGALSYWQSSRISSAEAAGTRFVSATRLMREGKTDEAMKAFAALAKDGAPGYQALARLRIAAAHASAGRTPEAIAAFEDVAKDTAGDPILRDFASLQAASLKLPTADWAEMERRLTPLMADKAPWRTAARELLALAAYKAGKKDDARKLYEALLIDRATPPALSERVQVMLSLLTDAEAPKEAPAAPAPAPGPEKTKDKSPAPPADKKK